MEIPLPPLEEQKRIAAILDKADAIRRKRQQAIQLADDFLRAVFLDMFGDPIENPKVWITEHLGMVAEFINGDRSSNYPSGEEVVDDGILFINTKNICNGRLSLDHKAFITPEKFQSLSRGKLEKYDLLITLRGTLGSCAIFDCEYDTGFINAQIMIIRCKETVLPEYLHALVTSRAFNRLLQRIGQGAAVPQLTASQLKNIAIPIPPLDVQRKFKLIIEKTRQINNRVAESNSNPLFKSLSVNCFTGEL